MRQPLNLVLLSGGLDSTACLHFYLGKAPDVKALFVDYGQRASLEERRAANAIANYYGVTLDEVVLTGLTCSPGFVNGRNALLISIALASFRDNSGTIVIGLHSYSPYPDTTVTFLRTFQGILDLYTDGCIGLEAPFASWTKLEIWQYLCSVNAPIERTYSCELGRSQPCGNCLSCQDLRVLYDSCKK